MTYDPARIAHELTETALGNSYYGNSLYVALDLPCITNNDRDCIIRWLYGSELIQDKFRLQEIAITIREWADENCVKNL